jgi:major type 1 subunit fimbrin (pilin)
VLSFVAQGAAHAHHISPPLLCFFGFLSLYLLEYFMKHLSVLVKIWGSMLALLVGSAVHAQNAGGTVSFSGSLTANTCAFQMGGVTQSALAVQLPVVPVASMATIGTVSLEAATFNVGFVNCGASPSPATAFYYLSSSQAANNQIGNKSSGGGAATGVAMQLYASDGSTTIPVTTTSTKYATGVTLGAANAAVNTVFKVKYIATAATPTAGIVTGDLIVNWAYQ